MCYRHAVIMMTTMMALMGGAYSPLAFADQKLSAADGIRVLYRTPPTPVQSCGEDSLYVCLKMIGTKAITLGILEEDLSPGPRGVPLSAIERCCRKHSINCVALRVDKDNAFPHGAPMILHVNGDHFIAVLGQDGDRLRIFDNVVGLYDCTKVWFRQAYRWDGTALVVGTMPMSLVFRLFAGPMIIVMCGAGMSFVLWKMSRGKATVIRQS
jgi:hypothetical protein